VQKFHYWDMNPGLLGNKKKIKIKDYERYYLTLYSPIHVCL